jgi:hypothetical protein
MNMRSVLSHKKSQIRFWTFHTLGLQVFSSHLFVPVAYSDSDLSLYTSFLYFMRLIWRRSAHRNISLYNQHGTAHTNTYAANGFRIRDLSFRVFRDTTCLEPPSHYININIIWNCYVFVRNWAPHMPVMEPCPWSVFRIAKTSFARK